MKPHTNYILMSLCLARCSVAERPRGHRHPLRVADTFITGGIPGNSAGGNPWFDAGTDGQLTPGVRRGLLPVRPLESAVGVHHHLGGRAANRDPRAGLWSGCGLDFDLRRLTRPGGRAPTAATTAYLP